MRLSGQALGEGVYVDRPLLRIAGTIRSSIALIFAVALGIAVDDTIHLLTRYVRERRAGGGEAVDPGSARAGGQPALQRPDEARASFAEVSELARAGARYQRKDNQKWVGRAFWGRLV